MSDKTIEELKAEIIEATKSNDYAKVRELANKVSYLADLDGDKMVEAARIGAIEKVKIFLKNGTNINARDDDSDSVLYWAVRNSDIKFIEYLLEKGADPNLNIIANNNSHSILLQALGNEQFKICKLLIDSCISIRCKESLIYRLKEQVEFLKTVKIEDLKYLIKAIKEKGELE